MRGRRRLPLRPGNRRCRGCAHDARPGAVLLAVSGVRGAGGIAAAVLAEGGEQKGEADIKN